MTLLSTPPNPQPMNPTASSDFTALAERVHAAGLLRRRYGYYWTKLIGSVVLLASLATVFLTVGDSWWQLLLAGVLGVLLTQIAFLGHDAAHRQIFKSGKWNDWVSLVIANLLVGISYGWWRSKHTRHHANPNKEGADPDLDVTMIAFTPDRARRHRPPVVRWLVAHQGWFFFPILFFEGLSLHVSGVRRVLSREKIPRRAVEIGFLVVRLGGYLALVLLVLPPGKAAAFLGVQLGVFGFYMGAVFAPNHTGMPLIPKKLKVDFLRRQVLMSRDISGGRFISVLMGGLNYQIEHHLFPSMPRPHLRKVQPMIAAYCADLQVAYTETTLWQSYGIIVRYLNTVGLAHRDPFLCPLVAGRRGL